MNVPEVRTIFFKKIIFFASPLTVSNSFQIPPLNWWISEQHSFGIHPPWHSRRWRRFLDSNQRCLSGNTSREVGVAFPVLQGYLRMASILYTNLRTFDPWLNTNINVLLPFLQICFNLLCEFESIHSRLIEIQEKIRGYIDTSRYDITHSQSEEKRNKERSEWLMLIWTWIRN